MLLGLRNLLLVLLAAVVGLVAALYLFQDRVLFPQRPLGEERLTYIRENFTRAVEVRIDVSEGVTLHGWLMEKPGQEKGPLLLYFGGNGEEVSRQLETAHLLPGPLLAVNYRGYGLSEGRPGEEALLQDALAIYDWAAASGALEEAGVVVMGRSIGAGVAVHLASARDVRGVILVSPYDSITAVARDQLPFLPSSFIKHPFRAVQKAPEVEAPLLAIIGREDRLIRPRRSLELVSAWEGPSDVKILPGGHNDLQENPLFWDSILEFLESLGGGSQPGISTGQGLTRPKNLCYNKLVVRGNQIRVGGVLCLAG